MTAVSFGRAVLIADGWWPEPPAREQAFRP